METESTESVSVTHNGGLGPLVAMTQFYFSDLRAYPLPNRVNSIIQTTRENNSCSIEIKCIIQKCNGIANSNNTNKIIIINNNKERKDNTRNSDVSGLN